MTKPKPKPPEAPSTPVGTVDVSKAPLNKETPVLDTQADTLAIPGAPDAPKAEDAPAVETKEYPDGTTATGTAPLPEDSPADGASMVDPLIETAPDGDPIKPEEGVYACNVTTLAAARALPEVGAEIEPLPMVYAPGSVQRFKAEDGRTMNVIRVHGAIAAQAAA